MTSHRAAINALTAAAVVVTLGMVIKPDAAFQASTDGLKLFLEVVLPSLLPFFVLSEVLLGLGFVHFMGVLFEPLMRPLFGVPGVGAFAMSMGLAAGYPMDAVITGKFRRAGMCSRVEGERLLAFTNTADPLFIFGAVAVGMFGRPELGAVLALGHYLGALGVGLAFKLHGRGDQPTPEPGTQKRGSMLGRAYRAMVQQRDQDGRPLGRLFGDAVTDSIRTLWMIGGFIITFSVLITILAAARLDGLIAWPIAQVFSLIGLDPSLVGAALRGLFEIDLGTLSAARAVAPFMQQAAVAGGIIAWSGLSVHGQVAAVISDTDIRLRPYVVARLLHAALSGAITFWLLAPDNPISRVLLGWTPIWAPVKSAPLDEVSDAALWLNRLGASTERALVVAAAILAVAVGLWFFRSLRVVVFRARVRA